MWIHGVVFTGKSGSRVNKIYQIWAAWVVPEQEIPDVGSELGEVLGG